MATALALPWDFPDRGMLLFTAFAATLGTLVLQGLTLRPLVVAVGLLGEASVRSETRFARLETLDAALAELEGDKGKEAGELRLELTLKRDAVASSEEWPNRQARRFLARATDARRNRLHELRRTGAIGDDAFHGLVAELDLAELTSAPRT